MSHFTRIETQLTDLDCLVQALAELGYTAIEMGQVPLYGWHGDDRSKLSADDPNYAPLCDVVIKRKHLTSASNDIGFARQPNGTYQAYISDYDQQALPGWLGKVTQRYALNMTIQGARWAGYNVEEQENQADGSIRLVVSKW